MNKWRIFSVAAAAAMLLTGCAKIEQDTMPELIAATETTPLVPVATAAEQPSHESVALQVPEITREEADITLEAEDGSIPTGCSVSIVPRLGYSGTGYLSGLNAENGSTLELEADIPATQHYDITVVLGADTPSTCRILANGEPVYTLKAEENENFVRATVQGIFLSKGKCKLEIEPVSGIVDIDCVELVNNTSLYDEDAAISQTPVNPHASASAKALLKFLADSYGRKIVTGQYVSDSTNRELEQIYQVTGAYPLIRFADMQNYSRNGGNAAQATAVEDSLAWAQEGGIAGLSWYWNAPAGNASIYAKDTTFDLSAAVTDKDIATATDAQLSQMAASGEISEGCYAMIQDIDAVSEQLKKLADADVPVLWRPLMEAGFRCGCLPLAVGTDVHPYDGVPPAEQPPLDLERTEQQLSGGQIPVRYRLAGCLCQGQDGGVRQPVRTVCGAAEYDRRKTSGAQRVQYRPRHERHVP